MNNSKQELQNVLLSMLHDFDAVCKKHDIKYMLFAGTALGAVRHNGFIPWDDDLDIIMLRPDYEKFFSVAAKELSKDKYYVQKEFTAHWPMFFSKLRLNNTAAMEKYHARDPEMHQGIFIDIFPSDNLSDNAFLRKLQFLASKAVIAKSLDRRGYLTDSRLKKIFMLACRLLPQKLLWKFCIMHGKPNTRMVHTFFACSSKYERSVFPREWLVDTRKIKFCDGEFPISYHYDKLLTALYGDYMTLPPEEGRKCKEHIAILDFDRSFENYIDEQNNMTVETFTRSIR